MPPLLGASIVLTSRCISHFCWLPLLPLLPLQTFEGIDVCGERLAAEIAAVAAAHPGLRRISLLSHSLGGLIRCACSCVLVCACLSGELPLGQRELPAPA